MALIFKTTDPTALLTGIKKAIDEGRIDSWSYDDDGDFTHTSKEWDSEAWLRPKLRAEKLKFSILIPVGNILTSEIYAIYHGRFIESALVHCDLLFDNVSATALPDSEDVTG